MSRSPRHSLPGTRPARPSPFRRSALRVHLALLLSLAACAVDEWWEDEVIVRVELPDEALRGRVVTQRYFEGNVPLALRGCNGLERVFQADFQGPGEHVLTVTTESAAERDGARVLVWIEEGANGEPGCGELGLVLDLAISSSAELLVPDDLSLFAEGGAVLPEPGRETNDCDSGDDDDSGR